MHVNVRITDTFLVSYPRSGSTWLRFMLANLVVNPSVDISFANIETYIPDIYVATAADLEQCELPRLIKSHESFNPQYRRTVYIMRDPRDVAASYLAYLRKMRYIPDSYSPEMFVRQFIAGELDTFGTWKQNVESWLAARKDDPDFLAVRYEDIRSDPQSQLTRIADFVGLQSNEQQICNAVAASDISIMRELERSTGHLWKPLENSRSDLDFVRRGEIGSAAAELPRGALAIIEMAWADLMSDHGYPAHPMQSPEHTGLQG